MSTESPTDKVECLELATSGTVDLELRITGSGEAQYEVSRMAKFEDIEK